MASVRTGLGGGRAELDQELRPVGRAASTRVPDLANWSLFVLDLVYVLGVIALFVTVGLLGKAVEKL
ncbi:MULTISPECIES: hypothetical protein [unclassified Microbacterium]|uniref:hypothetical protein n=1 Tax=unclassified Microbacterium TaxID=2609290 RepID=UPI00214ACCF2|nr:MULTISPECIES: hypothetical protein [unclassified Microbacterium]MCR2784832.1 hypothetical protein [Microbacterium sp. zg.B96]WIM16370.1 hypothetical protein QNO11_01685 [Microbacterium sp. zg-B96]